MSRCPVDHRFLRRSLVLVKVLVSHEVSARDEVVPSFEMDNLFYSFLGEVILDHENNSDCVSQIFKLSLNVHFHLGKFFLDSVGTSLV